MIWRLPNGLCRLCFRCVWHLVRRARRGSQTCGQTRPGSRPAVYDLAGETARIFLGACAHEPLQGLLGTDATGARHRLCPGPVRRQFPARRSPQRLLETGLLSGSAAGPDQSESRRRQAGDPVERLTRHAGRRGIGRQSRRPVRRGFLGRRTEDIQDR